MYGEYSRSSAMYQLPPVLVEVAHGILRAVGEVVAALVDLTDFLKHAFYMVLVHVGQ
jgi:hypothetical protein